MSTAPGQSVIPAAGERADRVTAELLWESCHRRLDPSKLLAVLSSGPNMTRAVSAAVDNRIGQLLWRALESVDRLDVLGEQSAWLTSLVDAYRMAALILLPRALHLALEPLTDTGLEPVVLKGPSVTARYPDSGLRPMDDIDLLLPRDQHPYALVALERAGWRIERGARRDRYDVVLAHPDVPSLLVELHHELEPSHERTTTLSGKALWEHRVPAEYLGVAAFSLPLPRELVVLAAHAGKPSHAFGRLVWIADLAMVVGSNSERGVKVDWEAVRAIARDSRCLTVVSTTLALARFVGVDAPRAMFPLPDRGWRAAAINDVLDLTWPLRSKELGTYHLRYALTDGWFRRARLLVGSSHDAPARRRVTWLLRAPAHALKRWWALVREDL